MAWTLNKSTAGNYFQKPDGTVVYFTGSHTWTNGTDLHQAKPPQSPPGSPYPPVAFDFTSYLNWMASHSYNFMRYWIEQQTFVTNGTTFTFLGFTYIWSKSRTYYSNSMYPVPYARPGPGTAADTLPKYDLDTWNQSYFDRIRTRCIAAAAKGIYVDIILFEGATTSGSWIYHPFKETNNINGFDADPNNTGLGIEMMTMTQPATLVRQKAFVAKVIDTVNDLDNVLYEVGNELAFQWISWQYEIINYIHTYEATKAKQHPVGMTCTQWTYPQNVPYPPLLSSPADWISPPGHDGNNFDTDPPQATGNKIHIIDLDHVWPGDRNRSLIDKGQWIWKGFLRGHSVIHMDDVEGLGIVGNCPDDPNERVYDVFRITQKQTALYAARCNLRTTVPNGALCSTGYCIANPGIQYLAMRPTSSGSFTVNLSAGAGKAFTAEWYDIANSITHLSANVNGGSSAQSFTSPFSQPSVLFLNVINPEIPQHRTGIFFLGPGGGSSIVSARRGLPNCQEIRGGHGR